MRFKRSILIAALCVVSLPAASQARNLELPSNLMGITEVIYNQLNMAHCYIEDAPLSAVSLTSGTLCDPIVAKYEGKIVMRVEHLGELYRVNTGDGFPLLTSYLPDGFYRAGNHYYWVSNGLRVRVKKSNAHTKLVSIAQRTPNTTQPLTSAQLDTLAIQQRYVGKLGLIVDQQGELAYISDPADRLPVFIGRLTNKELFELIRQEATVVDVAGMQNLMINNDWR